MGLIRSLWQRIDGFVRRWAPWFAAGSFALVVGVPLAKLVLGWLPVVIPGWLEAIGTAVFSVGAAVTGVFVVRTMTVLKRLQAATQPAPLQQTTEGAEREPENPGTVELLEDDEVISDPGWPEPRYDTATGTMVDAAPRLALEWTGARLEYHGPVGRVKLRMEIRVRLLNDLPVEASAQPLEGRTEVRPLSNIEGFESFELEDVRLLTPFSLPDQTRYEQYATIIGSVPDTRKVRRALVALRQNAAGRCLAVRITCQWTLSWEGESHSDHVHLRGDNQHLWGWATATTRGR